MPEPFPFQDGERFELVSRGDLVPGRLWRSDGAPLALVWLVASLDAGKDAAEVAALARAAAAEGLWAAAIDLPLQGERASAKLSARLAAGAAGALRSATDRLLWEEFLRQAALDLDAALAALRTRASLERVACVAFGSGDAPASAWTARTPGVALLRAAPGGEPAPLVAELRRALARS